MEDSNRKPGNEFSPPAAVMQAPAVPIGESVQLDYIVCLEDGRRLKMMKRYLRKTFGLTPEQYRAKWGLPPSYPMVAPRYALEARSPALRRFRLAGPPRKHLGGRPRWWTCSLAPISLDPERRIVGSGASTPQRVESANLPDVSTDQRHGSRRRTIARRYLRAAPLLFSSHPSAETDAGGALDETETEADTCRRLITPRLQAAGWDNPPHQLQEQRTITPGRILFTRSGTRRGQNRRLDYLLRYRPDLPIAVVEAKASYLTAAEGMQQAKLYATMLGLKFAYASNGTEILEYDFLTGLEKPRQDFPHPDELWDRQGAGLGLDERAQDVVLTPVRPDPERPIRYYQEAAVNQAVQAIAAGQRYLFPRLIAPLVNGRKPVRRKSRCQGG